jgi:hypothetical protein
MCYRKPKIDHQRAQSPPKNLLKLMNQNEAKNKQNAQTNDDDEIATRLKKLSEPKNKGMLRHRKPKSLPAHEITKTTLFG